jgi:hypothetical protein
MPGCHRREDRGGPGRGQLTVPVQQGPDVPAGHVPHRDEHSRPRACGLLGWDRWPLPSITVSTHSSRPPVSDSQSQIADVLDVLALVECAPSHGFLTGPGRGGPGPVGQQAGSRGHRVRTSTSTTRASITTGESKSQSSKRTGNRTSSPVKSAGPLIAARRRSSPSPRPTGGDTLSALHIATERHQGVPPRTAAAADGDGRGQSPAPGWPVEAATR